MKFPLRIALPVAGALLVAGTTLAFFRWQLKTGVTELRQSWIRPEETPRQTKLMPDDPAEAGDRSLLFLRRGDLAAWGGDWTQAETEYQQAVDAGGGIVALRKLAQAQMQRRKFDAVTRTIHRLEREGDRSEDVLLLRSLVHLRTGQADEAQTLLDAAPASPQKHYALALLAISRTDHERAQSELKQVVTGWEPELRDSADVLLRAYDEFALFPDGSEAHLDTLLARGLAGVQECEIALPLLSHALGGRDDYRDAWIVQGYCELMTERHKQALASLERAYAIDPEKPETQYFLGRAHAMNGDHRNAVTFLQYALRNGLQPEDEVRRILAMEAERAGDPDTALAQYKALATLPDADVDAFTAFVTYALSVGQTKDAYDAAATAVKKWPDDARTQELLGWSAGEAGDRDAAIAALEKALQLDPTRESARERLKKLTSP
ncbi:MAG: tpr domain-containing protein [Candidatus Peregrinibacteria bacterium Greene0416_19]|nr:MAG: tpr domain-containing protein [Candidatus Peregrinibacteria bacterium Greene0416_19]